MLATFCDSQRYSFPVSRRKEFLDYLSWKFGKWDAKATFCDTRLTSCKLEFLSISDDAALCVQANLW